MTAYDVVKWIHLLAVATWTGGLIVLAILVAALRKQTDDVEVLRAAARAFGYASWTAMAVAMAAGVWLYLDWGLAWSEFLLKGTILAATLGLTIYHQITARNTSPMVRGIIRTAILVLSIILFYAAVILVPGR